jgi:hypothetical protein
MSLDPKKSSSTLFSPEGYWEDLVLARSRIDELLEQSKLTGDLAPVEAALGELNLKTANYRRLLEEMQAPMRAELGRNFLGTKEWSQAFGFEVGLPPVIPEYITTELLNSPCPLHPGQRIKDSHLLVFMPKTFRGQPYSAVGLYQLCAARRGPGGEHYIYERSVGSTDWKMQPWATATLSESRWLLIPKSDPNPTKVPPEMHFRAKCIAAQESVLADHYQHAYRSGTTLEIMTAVILNYLVNGEKILVDAYLRAKECNNTSGRVSVGLFRLQGLQVDMRDNDYKSSHSAVGFALVRKAATQASQ